MGIINFSIPKQFVQRFTSKSNFTNFIETGTYEGNTSFWAASIFPKVYTIEIDPAISKSTSEKSECPDNVSFYIGDSKEVLPKIIPLLKGRSFFWLDGHWCLGAGGKDEECPLLSELFAIKDLKDSVIFIDDARCFLGPLPPPHNAKHWPRIDEIFGTLKELFPDSIATIIDDVIVCYPHEFSEIVDEYWQGTFEARYSTQNLVKNNSATLSKNKFIFGAIGVIGAIGAVVLKKIIFKAANIKIKNEVDIGKRTKLTNWFKEYSFKTIIDIGANEGQFAEEILTLFPNAHIHSFEPLKDVFERLELKFQGKEDFFGYNLGLGDVNEQKDIYNNEYSPSSSILEMLDLHKSNFNYAIKTSPVNIPLCRLDDVAFKSKIVEPMLIKIDVQGYEMYVLKGGENTIKKAKMIIIETSFQPLYKDQPLFDDIYCFLKERGFYYVGNMDQLLAPTDDRILQADAIFINAVKLY